MRHRWLKIVVNSLMIFTFIGLIIFGFVRYKVLNQPITLVNNVPKIIVIDRNSSASSFVNLLKKEELIKYPRLFLWFVRLNGVAHNLKAGIYQISPGEKAAQLLKKISHGDVIIESFRIIDGTTLAQVSDNLRQAPYLAYNQIDWSKIKGNYLSAEGLLLADTYHYDAGSMSNKILELANKNLNNYLNNSWLQRSKDLPYKSSYELLIVASIIEKESSIPAERRLISGVIINRLQKSMPLQMDPTVIYALGINYKGKLTKEDLHIDSPYNTYLNRGLPPTPISMVGKDAIDAAAHPTLSNYLYFVARGDGSHDFSVNYEEQQQAVSRYRKLGK